MKLIYTIEGKRTNSWETIVGKSEVVDRHVTGTFNDDPTWPQLTEIYLAY